MRSLTPSAAAYNGGATVADVDVGAADIADLAVAEERGEGNCDGDEMEVWLGVDRASTTAPASTRMRSTSDVDPGAVDDRAVSVAAAGGTADGPVCLRGGPSPSEGPPVSEGEYSAV